jgi:cytochrome c peroxidase
MKLSTTSKTIVGLLSLAAVVEACQKNEANAKQLVLDKNKLGVSYNDEYSGPFTFEFGDLNTEVTDLGRVLFYDESLSLNERVSCGSCHIQSHGFADLQKASLGFAMGETARNSMSLSNLESTDVLFWDGRESDLTNQVVKPITNHLEMGYGSMVELVNRLNTKDYYNELFEDAFGSSEITEDRISWALESFIKSLRSHRNMVDIALAESGSFSLWSSSAIVELSDPVAQRGFELFGELGCSNCHNGINIGGKNMANIGLEMDYTDPGLATWSDSPGSVGVFKIPSLRNVALTAPYMHDGRFATLEEVIEHYNSGIVAHPNLNWMLTDAQEIETVNDLINAGFDPVEVFAAQEFNSPSSPRRLNLTDLQKADLLAFLQSLTDYEMLSDPRYSNPFVLEEL